MSDCEHVSTWAMVASHCPKCGKHEKVIEVENLVAVLDGPAFTPVLRTGEASQAIETIQKVPNAMKLVEMGEMHGMSDPMPFPGLMLSCSEEECRQSAPLLGREVVLLAREELDAILGKVRQRSEAGPPYYDRVHKEGKLIAAYPLVSAEDQSAALIVENERLRVEVAELRAAIVRKGAPAATGGDSALADHAPTSAATQRRERAPLTTVIGPPVPNNSTLETPNASPAPMVNCSGCVESEDGHYVSGPDKDCDECGGTGKVEAMVLTAEEAQAWLADRPPCRAASADVCEDFGCETHPPLARVAGKWPGDETDAEIQAVMNDMKQTDRGDRLWRALDELACKAAPVALGMYPAEILHKAAIKARRILDAEQAKPAATPTPSKAGVTDPHTRDMPCPDCGQVMTNHVVVTRHENSACSEQFTGPPLRVGLSSSKAEEPDMLDVAAVDIVEMLGGAWNGAPSEEVHYLADVARVRARLSALFTSKGTP